MDNFISKVQFYSGEYYPNWLNFGLFAKELIKNRLNDEWLTIHSNKSIPDINIILNFDENWLWFNSYKINDFSANANNYKHNWKLVKQMLRKEYLEYIFTFSKIPNFWCNISYKYNGISINKYKNTYTTCNVVLQKYMNYPTTTKMCYYGAIIGDCIGVRYASLSSQKAIDLIYNDYVDNHLQIFNRDITLNGQLFIIGINVCDAIKDLEILPFHIAYGYSDWYITKKDYNCPTVLHNAFSGIDKRWDKQFIYNKMIEKAECLNMNNLNNKFLVRCLSLCFMDISFNDQFEDIVKKVCSLTNPNFQCLDAARVYIFTVKQIMTGFSKNKLEIWKSSLDYSKTKLVKNILKNSYLKNISTYNIKPDDEEGSYFGVALQITFYEFINGSNFEESIINICKLGGDTNTNAFIAGGLLGIWYKMIPEDWIQKVDYLLQTL